MMECILRAVGPDAPSSLQVRFVCSVSGDSSAYRCCATLAMYLLDCHPVRITKADRVMI